MSAPKYKLVRPFFTGFVAEGPWGRKAQKVYRIKALRNIPEFGIKAGEFGGLVTSEMNLSQFGECWIDYHAKVFGHVFIVDNAYIGGKSSVTCDMEKESIVIRGNTQTSDNATITIEENPDGRPITDTFISGDIVIRDNAVIRNVGVIRGEVSIYDDVVLDGVTSIRGEVGFDGTARVNRGSVIEGRTFILDRAVISENCTVINSIIDGSAMVFEGDTVEDFNQQEDFFLGKKHGIKKLGTQDIMKRAEILNKKANGIAKRNTWVDGLDALGKDLDKLGDELDALGDDLLEEASLWGDDIWEDEEEWGEFTDKHGSVHYGKDFHYDSTAVKSKEAALSSVEAEKQALINDALLLLAELNQKNHEYESDIVKIIKYPVMADKGYATTAELHVALGRANRMSLNPAHTGFVDAVTVAEKAFIAAESYALKMASTVFTEAEQKKVSKVTDLLSIAANEASSDNEKEQAFKQAFKHLEGVIAVPEVAVDTFRVKIGLKEISM